MSEKYFAVQFWRGRNETTGEANKVTGLMNIACDIEVFSSKDERDKYVLEGIDSIPNLPFDDNCREALTEKEARQLCLGMSDDEFEAHANSVLDNGNTQVSNAALQVVRGIDRLQERYKKLSAGMSLPPSLISFFEGGN